MKCLNCSEEIIGKIVVVLKQTAGDWNGQFNGEAYHPVCVGLKESCHDKEKN